jgi:hypothetical protein
MERTQKSRIAQLEEALRKVRRLGQHEPARRIINEALGDTWEEETGFNKGSTELENGK